MCERRRTELYAKQGRKNQFTSAEERDRWITEVNNENYCYYVVCLGKLSFKVPLTYFI